MKLPLLLGLIAAAALVLAPPAAMAEAPPGTPPSVSVSRADGTLTASWDAVPGATAYHVTYSSDGKQSWGLAALNHAGTAITIDVDNAKAYVVGVRAKNGSGGGGWRNSPSAAPFTPPPPAPPGTPSAVSVERADGTLTASWDAVSGATNYHVTYTDNGAQSWRLAALSHAETSIAIDVDNAKTYIVGVRAKNAGGGGGWRNSPSAGAFVPPTPEPTPEPGIIVQDGGGNAVTALSVPEGGEAGYQVKLAAQPAQDVEVCIGLSVRGNNDPDITFKGEADGVVALKLTFTPGNWDTAQTVTLVAAEDGDAVNGARDVTHDAREYYGGSVDWTATEVDNDPAAPPARPTGLTAAPGDGSVTLAWDDPSDSSITGYEHRTRRAPPAPGWGPWTVIPGSGAATTSHTFTGLDNGTEFRFKIRAVNAAGNSAPAPSAAPWYVAATPAAPTLTADGVTATGATITLGNWSGAWHYSANASGAGGAGASAASAGSNCNGPVNGGQATITGLDPNTAYTIAVYGGNGCGGGAIAAGAQFSTLPPAPGRTAKPIAAPRHHGAEVSWTAPTGTVTSYQIQWRPCLVTFGESGGGCVTYDSPPPPQNTPDTRTPIPAWAPWGAGTWLDGLTSGEVAATSSPDALSGLRNGVRYQTRVRAVNSNANGASYGAWSTPSDDVWPNTQYSLTASNVTGSEATLTVAAASGSWRYDAWYYKADTAPHTACSSAVSATTVTVTGLTEHAAYIYTAYTDSGCTDALASAAAFTTSGDDLTAGSVTTATATLTLAGHTGNWWLKKTAPTPAGTCTAGEADFSHALTNLTAGTAYIYTAYNDAACTVVIDSASFITIGLSASSITKTTATLTIAGHIGAWHYKADKAPDTTCSSAVSTTTKDLAGLSTGTTYVYKAYSDAACTIANLLATANAFTTLATLTVSAIGDTTATLALEGRTGDWRYKADKAPHNTCSSAVSTTTKDLTGLSANTAYVYKAYSDSACADANLLATLAFRSAVSVSNLAKSGTGYSVVGGSSGIKLAQQFTTGRHSAGYTLRGVTVAIKGVQGSPGDLLVYLYTDSGGKPGSLAATLTGGNPTGAGNHAFACSTGCALDDDTAYHVVLAASGPSAGNSYQWLLASTGSQDLAPLGNGWGLHNQHQQHTTSGNAWNGYTGALKVKLAATVNPTLTVTGVTESVATLNIGDYTGGAWWHKRTAPTTGSCVAVAHGAVASFVSGLTGAPGAHLQGLRQGRAAPTPTRWPPSPSTPPTTRWTQAN